MLRNTDKTVTEQRKAGITAAAFQTAMIQLPAYPVRSRYLRDARHVHPAEMFITSQTENALCAEENSTRAECSDSGAGLAVQ